MENAQRPALRMETGKREEERRGVLGRETSMRKRERTVACPSSRKRLTQPKFAGSRREMAKMKLEKWKYTHTG